MQLFYLRSVTRVKNIGILPNCENEHGHNQIMLQWQPIVILFGTAETGQCTRWLGLKIILEISNNKSA